MPKSCSLRASMPIRTLGMISRQEGLSIPPGVVESIAAPRVAAGARIDTFLPRPLVERQQLIADVERHPAHLAVPRTAGGRHGTLHGARIEQRKPLVIESGAHLALVTGRTEASPVVVEVLRRLSDLRHPLIEGFLRHGAPLVGRRRDGGR